MKKMIILFLLSTAGAHAGSPNSNKNACNISCHSEKSLIKQSLLFQQQLLAGIKKEKKSQCEMARSKWQEKIIGPMLAEMGPEFESLKKVTSADEMNQRLSTLKLELEKQAEFYVKKYHKKSWFDGRPKETRDTLHSIHYIPVSIIERNINLQRIVDKNPVDTKPSFEERASTLPRDRYGALQPITGIKESNPLHSAFIVGRNEVATVDVPKTDLSDNRYVIGGTYSYTLDALNQPDTFLISDNSKELEPPIKNAQSVHRGSGAISNLDGNIKIDVDESLDSYGNDTSNWDIALKFKFLQLKFNIYCDDAPELPCPVW